MVACKWFQVVFIEQHGTGAWEVLKHSQQLGACDLKIIPSLGAPGVLSLERNTAGHSCFLEWSKWLGVALPKVRLNLNSPRSVHPLDPTTGFLINEVVFPIIFFNAMFSSNQKPARTKDSSNMENWAPGWHRTEGALGTPRFSFLLDLISN